MHRRAAWVCWVMVAATCGLQGMCLGQDAPAAIAERRQAVSSPNTVVLTKALPLSADETAEYGRRQEMAAQKQLLDSSVASISDAEMIATYLLSATLIVGVTLGAVFLALA